MRKQSGRLIELQILVAAVFMAVVIFIAQMAGDQGFMKSLLVSAGTVFGVIAALVGLAFIGILPGEIREWYTTPVAVRAARKKNALEALRKIRPDRFDARAADRFGDTALHVVCDSYEEERKRGAPEIVDFLLQHGADANVKNTYGKTPLELAVQHEYGAATVRRLLAGGAEVSDVLIEAAGKSGPEAFEVVKTLVDAGAPVSAPNVLGTTPLHRAAKYGTAEMIRELLARGAEINARDRDGTTPLHDALWMPSLDERGTAENVAALVAAGADPDAKDEQGTTPRALAEKSGAPAVIAAMNGVSAEPLHRPQS